MELMPAWQAEQQKNISIFQAASSAAAQVVGTSKTFQPAQGPLVVLSKEATRLAREAASSAEPEYCVLVVDELNRAKVADVFGECFFLLEHRNAGATLRYSIGDEEQFKLHPNLLIIGTMNSADRNIDEQMDAAFVQRFSWVELAPNEAPVQGLLEAFLYAREQDGGVYPGAKQAKWLPPLIQAWNGVLLKYGCSDFAIGPRFFLNEKLYRDNAPNERIKKVWRDSLYPYLRLVLKPMGPENEYEIFVEMLQKGADSLRKGPGMVLGTHSDNSALLDLRIPPCPASLRRRGT